MFRKGTLQQKSGLSPEKHSNNLRTVIGFPSLAVCVLAEALLQNRYLGTDSTGGLAACLVSIYLYIVCYQFVDAPSFIWCAEIFPTTIRAKGISLAFFAYFVGAITYTSPFGLGIQEHVSVSFLPYSQR